MPCPALLIVALLVSAGGVSRGNMDPNERFNRAQSAYDSGDGAAAAYQYRRLEEEGFRHPNLLYNLGTVYGMAGDNARAVWYYRRAMRKAPRDSDTETNLMLVLKRANAWRPPTEGHALRWVRRASRLEWGRVFRTGYALTALGFGAGFWARHRRRIWLGTALPGFLLLATAGAGLLALAWDERYPEAVVAADAVYASSAPGEAHAEAFPIPKASLVRVLQTQRDWVQVQTGPHTGWVSSETIIPLNSPPERWKTQSKENGS